MKESIVMLNEFNAKDLCKKSGKILVAAMFLMCLTSPVYADGVTSALDVIKSDINGFMSGAHGSYELSEDPSEGAIETSFWDRELQTNRTYYFNPSEADRTVLNRLAKTGNSFLRVAQAGDSVVFTLGGTNYTYDTAMIPNSQITFTPTEETVGEGVFNIPDYDAKTGVVTDKYYKMTYNPKFYEKVSTATLNREQAAGHSPIGSAYTLTETEAQAGVGVYRIGDKYYQFTLKDGAVSLDRITEDQHGNPVTGYFINKESLEYGGAIYNNDGAVIGDITGDFINNSAEDNGWSSGSGGAIYNNGTIGNVTGDFINNYAARGAGGAIYNDNDSTMGNIAGNFIGNRSVSEGGAIYNDGTMRNITGIFIGNSSADNCGGAISNGWNATIEDISGVFINNTSDFAGGAITNDGQIGNITGDFINNHAENIGGAIDNDYSADIGNITGNFIGNSAGWDGGAIGNNENSIIGNITGNFISNSAGWNGGAIADVGGQYIGNITGNFIGNSAGSRGGAIFSYEVESITGNFINNSVTGDNNLYGGAIYYSGYGNIEISGNFIGNHVIANTEYDPEVKGGAIYREGWGDITLTSDNAVYLIKDNYTEALGVRDDNAIYMGNESTINLKQINNGELYLYDNIRGGDDYNDYSVNVTGDGTGTLHLYNDFHDANVFMGNVNLDTVNNQIHNYAYKNFTLTGNVNMSIDVDLENRIADRITAEAYGAHNGNINISNINVIADAVDENTTVKFAEDGLAHNVVNSATTAETRIFRYNVSYSIEEDDEDPALEAGYLNFSRIAKDNGDYRNYNPAVLAPPVSAQAGVQSTVNTTVGFSFNHVDTYSMLPTFERIAMLNKNKYAFGSTNFNRNLNYSRKDLYDESNKGIWVKPYTTFENIPLKNGPKVDAITYGTMIGYDSDFHKHRHGWNSVWSVYTGYTGGTMKFQGIDTTMNGGLLGVTDTFYRGNFWTALTATTGAVLSETSAHYGHDESTSLYGAIASKTGYNFEFKDGKYIIQPILMASYIFNKTFDYTTSNGVRINSDPLHTIQINPTVRFIGNFKNGWQPYLSVGMHWNLLGNTDVSANGYKLPSMHVKPYVEYGLGIQKLFKDRFTGFAQAMVRNGGRNGVALTFGFRASLGK